MNPVLGTYYPSWYTDEIINENQIRGYIDLIELIHNLWRKFRIIREDVRDQLEDDLDEALESVREIERNGKEYRLLGIGRPVGLHKRLFPREAGKDPHRSPDLLLKGILMLKNGDGLTFYNPERNRILKIPQVPGRLFVFDSREIHSGSIFHQSYPEYWVEFRLCYREVD